MAAKSPKVIDPEGAPVAHFVLPDRSKEANADPVDNPFRFQVGDKHFTMGSPASVDWQLSAATVDGQLRPFLRELLGEEGYAEFCALPKVLNADIRALLEACTEYYEGVGRGK